MKLKQRDSHDLPGSERANLAVPLTVAMLAALVAVMMLGAPGLVLHVTEILIWILFAASLNLLLSYGGMVSFGHAAYFGLGAYGFALMLKWTAAPIWLAMLTGPLLATLAAVVFGALCVRLTAIYFAMLTLACAEITFAVIFQWYDFTGGDTGIAGIFASGLGLGLRAFGAIVAVIVLLCLYLLWRLIRSPFGFVIRCVGQNPVRAAALGHNPRRVQLVTFVIAGFFAGVAGMLFAAHHGNVFPDYAGMLVTLTGLIIVILGGIGSFGAAIYGAIVYKGIDQYASQYIAYWEFAIGLCLLAVILLSPTGISGVVSRLIDLISRRYRGR